MWDVSTSSWQKRACDISNRRLTDAERAYFFTETLPREVCPASHLFAPLAVVPTEDGRTPLRRHIEKVRPGPEQSTVLAETTRSLFLEIRPSSNNRRDTRANDRGGQQTIETRLQRFVAKKLGLDGYIWPGSSLADTLGTGKSEKAALLKAVGKEFGFEIPAEDAEKIVNFQDLLTYVERRANVGKLK